MNRYKDLLRNIGLLSINNFGTRILSFLLVPLYTSVLTTAEYGTFDLFYTTISLMFPILTLSISDGILRFVMDKDSDFQASLTAGLKVIFGSSIVFTALVALNGITNLIPSINQYLFYFVLMYAATVLYQTITLYVRGRNCIRNLTVAGLMNSSIIIGSNILFLLVFEWGLYGYFISWIIAQIIPAIYLIVNLKIYKDIIFRKNDNSLILRSMLNYSVPLVLNSASWWINNSSNRYVVISICGIAANGIYSVAYKIPTILNVFQSIFLQAWQISAVHEFDSKDENHFFSNIYNSYNYFMVSACSVLIVFDQLIARFLYAKDFFTAWRYVPFLLIAALFGSLSGYMGGLFSAVKNSKIYSISTTIGAAVNLIFDIIFVYYWGPIGAAFATLLGYFIVWVIRLFNIKSIIHIELKLTRDGIAYLLLLVQSIILLTGGSAVFIYSLEIFGLITIQLLYAKEIKYLIGIIVYRKSGKKSGEILKGEGL